VPFGTILRRLDRVLYSHPFEGATARRYAAAARPAFGDLDDRLLDTLAPILDGAGSLLDVGAGPGTFAARAAARHRILSVIAIDPSRYFARSPDWARARSGVSVACAAAEALPLADASIDVAMCLSSIRYVRDRAAALRELRRVVRPGGRLVIVELDPEATSARIAAHADRLGTRLLRHAFGPLIVRTAPFAREIETVAIDAGWTRHALHDDPIQPVYIMELQ
jgi:ubiquinone/menaquinone biosynthesis C-methylase UbiE